MKVYVDELPKSWLECICRNGEYNYCKLIAPEHAIGYYNEEEMDYKDVPINQDFEELECPLQSLGHVVCLFHYLQFGTVIKFKRQYITGSICLPREILCGRPVFLHDSSERVLWHRMGIRHFQIPFRVKQC